MLLPNLRTTLLITPIGDARSGTLDPLLTAADVVVRLEYVLGA